MHYICMLHQHVEHTFYVIFIVTLVNSWFIARFHSHCPGIPLYCESQQTNYLQFVLLILNINRGTLNIKGCVSITIGI